MTLQEAQTNLRNMFPHSPGRPTAERYQAMKPSIKEWIQCDKITRYQYNSLIEWADNNGIS